MSIFHERLKLLRNTNDIMQKDLAKILNVSDRAFRNYENGTSEPTYNNLITLCNIFNVSADYLLGLSDDPTRH
ncbi:MAG: helix-turn-helix transcriptional regulator [Clostridiales bacterium]|nr:helix-turn-helix transcriptional regulator [Clostridiales bacterium]